jgi:hypothetical protein
MSLHLLTLRFPQSALEHAFREETSSKCLPQPHKWNTISLAWTKDEGTHLLFVAAAYRLIAACLWCWDWCPRVPFHTSNHTYCPHEQGMQRAHEKKKNNAKQSSAYNYKSFQFSQDVLYSLAHAWARVIGMS